MTVSPFHHEPRKKFTPQERARIFAENDGRCHKCSRKIGPADYWIVEHLHSLGRGGDNSAGNLGITCEWCLDEKNAEDAEELAHMRRSYTKAVVPKRFRKSRSWR
jgi:5-methylcytosine-specific restriction endonuclease McrA